MRSKIKDQKSKISGFTLIELLVVMVISVFAGGIIASILFSSLRGTTKTNSLTVVRQNGNFAISQMVKMIRDAKKLNSPCSASNSISISPFDGEDITFACSGQTITSNSASLLDQSSVSVSSCSFTCVQNSASDYPKIGINFVLTTLTTSQTQEKNASVPFQTSVIMRNVGR